MENALTRRAVLVEHLELTVPAIAGILLVPFFGLLKRIFGSSPMQLEPDMTQTEKRAEDSVADESEKPVHELD